MAEVCEGNAASLPLLKQQHSRGSSGPGAGRCAGAASFPRPPGALAHLTPPTTSRENVMSSFWKREARVPPGTAVSAGRDKCPEPQAGTLREAASNVPENKCWCSGQTLAPQVSCRTSWEPTATRCPQGTVTQAGRPGCGYRAECCRGCGTDP